MSKIFKRVKAHGAYWHTRKMEFHFFMRLSADASSYWIHRTPRELKNRKFNSRRIVAYQQGMTIVRPCCRLNRDPAGPFTKLL